MFRILNMSPSLQTVSNAFSMSVAHAIVADLWLSACVMCVRRITRGCCVDRSVQNPNWSSGRMLWSSQ